MDASATSAESDSLYNTERFWHGLFLLAITLNLVVILSSDLGLDAHVESAYVETENGWALDWGDVRTQDPLASNPSDAKEVPENSVTPGTVMPFAIIGLLIAIITANRLGLTKESVTVLLMNPALIFSIGRGYSEYTYLAMIGIAWAIWKMSRNYNTEKKPLARILAIGFSAILVLWVLVLKWKIEPFTLTIPLLALICVGMLIDHAPDSWFNPKKTIVSGFVFGLLSIVTLGLLGHGSFTVVTTNTSRFIQALPISVFGVIIVYGVVGMVLWPFLKKTWCNMTTSEDRLTGELALFIGTMAGAIVAYVACLWTYESILWNSEWPWHMWTMGNNGRYITILVIPSYLLIKRVNGSIDWNERNAIFGVLLILPLSLAAGLHGQTYWTDDAAEVLSENMEDGEGFVFIHDAALGMHYLYTFHTHIENVDERNITGHWRSPDSGWETELFSEEVIQNRGDLSAVNWIVLSPGIEWSSPPEGWYHTTGQADFMNGGGEWQIWTNHSETLLSET